MDNKNEILSGNGIEQQAECVSRIAVVAVLLGVSVVGATLIVLASIVRNNDQRLEQPVESATDATNVDAFGYTTAKLDPPPEVQRPLSSRYDDLVFIANLSKQKNGNSKHPHSHHSRKRENEGKRHNHHPHSHRENHHIHQPRP